MTSSRSTATGMVFLLIIETSTPFRLPSEPFLCVVRVNVRVFVLFLLGLRAVSAAACSSLTPHKRCSTLRSGFVGSSEGLRVLWLQDVTAFYGEQGSPFCAWPV